MPDEHRAAHEAGIDGFLRTGRGRGLDGPVRVRARRADGSRVPVSLTIWAQQTEGGWFFHALGHDLVDQETSEHALRVLAAGRSDLLHADTPERARQVLCQTVRSAAAADAAGLYEPADDVPDELRLVALSAAPGLPALERLPIAPGSLLREAWDDGRPRWFDLGDARGGQASGYMSQHGLRAVALEPVVLHGEVTGLLFLGWRAERSGLPAPVDTVLPLLGSEATMVASRLELLAQLERAAHADPLTGLANRRAFDRALARETERAGRAGSALALVLLDLDRFKAYNDDHGHPAGDQLLRLLAQRWASHLRAPDLLARLGGDEFAVLLPGADEAAAATLVRRLRDVAPEPVSVSAGTVLRHEGERPDELVARADAALYASKRAVPG